VRRKAEVKIKIHNAKVAVALLALSTILVATFEDYALFAMEPLVGASRPV